MTPRFVFAWPRAGKPSRREITMSRLVALTIMLGLLVSGVAAYTINWPGWRPQRHRRPLGSSDGPRRPPRQKPGRSAPPWHPLHRAPTGRNSIVTSSPERRRYARRLRMALSERSTRRLRYRVPETSRLPSLALLASFSLAGQEHGRTPPPSEAAVILRVNQGASRGAPVSLRCSARSDRKERREGWSVLVRALTDFVPLSVSCLSPLSNKLLTPWKIACLRSRSSRAYSRSTKNEPPRRPPRYCPRNSQSLPELVNGLLIGVRQACVSAAD
jgi:hypothetical protein